MTARRTPSTGANLRILVVEDEYLIATEIAHALEDMGHLVVGPAPTIAQALALIASEAIDCAFLDANLRGTSSALIATELAARSIPFFVVTGYGGLKLESDELDAAPRVHKPLSASDLAHVLAGAFAE